MDGSQFQLLLPSKHHELHQYVSSAEVCTLNFTVDTVLPRMIVNAHNYAECEQLSIIAPRGMSSLWTKCVRGV